MAMMAITTSSSIRVKAQRHWGGAPAFLASVWLQACIHLSVGDQAVKPNRPGKRARHTILVLHLRAGFLRFGAVGRVGRGRLRPHLLPPGVKTRAELGGTLGWAAARSCFSPGSSRRL